MQNDAEILIKKITTLPSLSPVVQKISAVIASPNASADEIVSVLKMDPAIAGKVLRLANSAYIGIPRTVSSLQNAVVILGNRRIYSLVLAASTLSAFILDSSLPFSVIRFWKHSITVALVCESIARHLKRYDAIEAGEMFCAGILHDLGKLVLGVYSPKEIQTAYKRAIEQRTPVYTNEQANLCHMRIGAMVAAQWNFPEMLIHAIHLHHTPLHSDAYKRTVSIVHIADIMVHLVGLAMVPEEATPKINADAMREIGLSPERLKVIANNALENEKSIESLIEFFS